MSKAQASCSSSHLRDLYHEVGRAIVQFSTESCPGGGGHSVHFYGSAGLEQAGAFHLRNRLLAQIRSQATFPRDATEMIQLLTRLLEFLSTVVLVPAEVFSATNAIGWAGNMHAPLIAGFEAMKGQLISMISLKLLDFQLMSTPAF